MKKITQLLILGFAASLAFAQQNTLVQSSLSNAVTATQTSFTIASATGINAPASGVPGSLLFVQDIGRTAGETMKVVGLSGTLVTVQRGGPGKAFAHASGAMVLIGTSPNWFHTTDPSGACTLANTFVAPWLNISNGNLWSCSAKSGTWGASWGNAAGTPQVLSGTATASVAGATAISGPLLEISGTNAITSFTMSVGWNGQSFCVFPTGAFTVTATNNIAKAATAVANRTLCFTYDNNASTAGFSPSY